jgi:acyl-CoA synthetase (AMP-forming)/AMP-acid ligase II
MRWTIADVIRRQAEERGDQPALTFADRTVTYGDLHDRSNRVAQALMAEGVGPHERVAYIDKNSVEFFEVLFGVAKMNAVNVAVNWRLSPPEMAHIVNDAEAKVLFVGDEFREPSGGDAGEVDLGEACGRCGQRTGRRRRGIRRLAGSPRRHGPWSVR